MVKFISQPMKKNRLFPTLFIFLSALVLDAQQFEINPVYYTIFDQDSLSGFNESEARVLAIQEGFLGSEFKIKMYRLKREYINKKYNLVVAHTKSLSSYFGSQMSGKTSVVPGCVNLDFEASVAAVIDSSDQIAGWTIVEGYNGFLSPGANSYYPSGLSNPSSCNLLGCCPMPPTHSELIDCSAPGGYIDATIGAQYPIFSVFGTGTVSGAAATNTQITQGLFGSKVLRLNDESTGDYSMAKLSRTFLVSTANNLFQFAFISVFAPAHGCCDAGAFQIILYDHGTSAIGTPTAITCPNFSVSAPGVACTATVPTQYYIVQSWNPHSSSNYNNIYNPWKISSMDLSNYVGKYITMEIITSDCNAGGHFGCVYFDAKCSSSEIVIGSGSSGSGQLVCAPVATLTAPAGFSSYQWTGPGAFSSTNAVINTTASGVYSLQLNDLSCGPIVKTIAVVVSNTTVQSISSSNNLICKGEGAILTAMGMFNCTWSTGDQTPSLFISPDSTTYYSVFGTNGDGCPVSTSYNQLVDECTGVKSEKLNSDIQLFPNPNNGDFILSLRKETDKTELVINNALGQEIHRQNIHELKNTIRLKSPKPGIYFFSVLNNKEIISKGKFKIE